MTNLEALIRSIKSGNHSFRRNRASKSLRIDVALSEHVHGSVGWVAVAINVLQALSHGVFDDHYEFILGNGKFRWFLEISHTFVVLQLVSRLTDAILWCDRIETSQIRDICFYLLKGGHGSALSAENFSFGESRGATIASHVVGCTL